MNTLSETAAKTVIHALSFTATPDLLEDLRHHFEAHGYQGPRLDAFAVAHLLLESIERQLPEGWRDTACWATHLYDERGQTLGRVLLQRTSNVAGKAPVFTMKRFKRKQARRLHARLWQDGICVTPCIAADADVPVDPNRPNLQMYSAGTRLLAVDTRVIDRLHAHWSDVEREDIESTFCGHTATNLESCVAQGLDINGRVGSIEVAEGVVCRFSVHVQPTFDKWTFFAVVLSADEEAAPAPASEVVAVSAAVTP